MKKALIGLLGAGLVVGLIAVLLVIAAAPSIVRQFKKSMLPKDMPELHPCVVNLQFGGTSTSLAGAIVTLHPEDETFEEWGTFSGTTDAKGKVVIKTEHNRKKYPGVFAGKYKVTVVKAVLPGISTDNPMNSHVEKRYAVKATTPLEINVPETGTHELFVHKANFSNPDDLPENIRTQVEEIERETHRPCSLTFHYREKPVPGLFLKLEPLQGGSQRDEEPLDRFSRVQREYIAFTNDEGVGKFVTDRKSVV